MSRNKNGFPSGGCPIPMGNNQICGETQTLEIIKEFRKLYEDKMKKIQSGGDYQSGLQATVNLQQNWIRDLTEQNEMLVRAVEELELEATDRVAMLEEKLCKSAQQGNEMSQKLEQKEKMLRESKEKLDRIPNETEALAVRLKEKDQELSTLRRISVEASEDSEDLRKRVRELEEENRVLQNQIVKAKSEVDSLSKQANAMTDKFATTTEQYEQERRQSKSVIEALKRENMQLADLKNNAENETQTTGELKSVQNIGTGTQSVVDSGQDTVNALRKELENLRNEHHKAQDLILTLNAEIQAQNERIEELKEILRRKGIESPYADPPTSTSKSQTSSTGNWSTPDTNIYNSEAANLPKQYKACQCKPVRRNPNLSEPAELQEALEKAQRDREIERAKHNQEIINLKQTISELEKALRNLQIRGDSLQKTDCMCGMNSELLKLREECKHQIKTNNYLKQQLMELSCACQSMQNMEAESKELQKMLHRVNGDLHHQADITKQELMREAQLNDLKAERIEELQNIVGAKTMELNQCAGECCKIQQQLNLTIKQNQELKAELAQLKNQIQNYRETAATSEERSEYCQKEIESCKCNISELSNRYMKTKEQLQQKNELCSKLEAELCEQNNNCFCLQKKIEDNNRRYEIDSSDLRHTITGLNDKLTKTENSYQILHEDYRRSQDQIIELTQRETKLQQDNLQHASKITETMQKLQNEELRLGECVCQLEGECAVLKRELMDKERQLELSQEENIDLKNEVNKVLQRYNKLKTEHEQLHAKFDELHAGLSKTEYQSHVTKEQFNQCLCGLQNANMEKDLLESKNKQLQAELEELQAAYRNMEQKYKKLNELVMTLEMKLLDNNMCREEICAESRNVITNVRAWLQNQTTINEELTQKLRDDEILIENLKQQIAMSQSHSRSKRCCCKIRQRGGGLNGDQSLRYVATRSQPDLWSPSSQGSGTVSPSSIVSNTQEWYTYEEFEEEDYIEDDSLLSHCLKRVESINQELQKSNRFWQNKMMDHDYLVTRDQ